MDEARRRQSSPWHPMHTQTPKLLSQCVLLPLPKGFLRMAVGRDLCIVFVCLIIEALWVFGNRFSLGIT